LIAAKYLLRNSAIACAWGWRAAERVTVTEPPLVPVPGGAGGGVEAGGEVAGAEERPPRPEGRGFAVALPAWPAVPWECAPPGPPSARDEPLPPASHRATPIPAAMIVTAMAAMMPGRDTVGGRARRPGWRRPAVTMSRCSGPLSASASASVSAAPAGASGNLVPQIVQIPAVPILGRPHVVQNCMA